MQFKDGVDRSGVSPVIWYNLPQIERYHHLFTRKELVVTSMRRPWGSHVHNPSPGEEVLAADLRRWHLDEMSSNMATAFCIILDKSLGRTLRVILEPEWLSAAAIEERGGIDAIAPHIHIQVEEEVFLPVWL